MICLDCHIEQILRKEFGQDAYFLTALGSVVDFSEFDYAELLHHFLNRELISEIVIVNDVDCTFIKNTINQEKNYNTRAEQELSKFQKNNADRLALLDTDKQKELLAKLNLQNTHSRNKSNEKVVLAIPLERVGELYSVSGLYSV